MDKEENKCKFKVDNDCLPQIKRNEEDYKLFKLEETGTKVGFDITLFKLENSVQLDSKYLDNITEIDRMKVKEDVKHNNSTNNKLLFRLKNEGDINRYASNELLSICKSEKIIIDIGNDLQPKTSEDDLGCPEGDFDHPPARAWHSSESGQKKKKNVPRTKRVDKSEIFTCSQCIYQSQSRKNFVSHLQVHSAIGKRKCRKLFQCAHCHYSSSKKSTLAKHLTTHGVYGEKSVYKCSQCGTEFKHRYNLIRHLSVEHLHDKPRPFKCPSCPVAYGTCYELNRHSLTHSRERPYECAHCDYATTRRYVLQEHLARHERNSVNSGGKTRIGKNGEGCTVKSCKETGRRKEEQMRHAGVCPKPHSVQSDKYPFECAVCGYRTSKHSFLKYHVVQKHTREPVFGCLTCDYSTFRREDLVKHRQSEKHDIFSCEHCDYTFFKYVMIEKHMKTHFK